MHVGLPSGYTIEGPNIVFVPLVIGALQVLLAIMTIYMSRRVNPPPLKNPTFFRWVVLGALVLLLFCGCAIINMSIFSPHILGSAHAVPIIGVASWLVMFLILAVSLNIVSKKNSIQRPNLMRYFALLISVLAAFLTTSLALVLIYAVPFEPPTTFPFLSGLMTIAFIPLALLLFGLSKDYVSVKSAEENRGQSLNSELLET